jgi:hypothetical protein
MQPIRIYPEYALILIYNIRPNEQDRYFRYITGEFLPAMEKRKLYMQNAWHVVYGKQPERQIEFVTEKIDFLRELFDDPEWERLEDRLKDYTENYEYPIVRYNSHFKIVRTPNSL